MGQVCNKLCVIQPTPVFLPGESQGRGSLVGCHLWGHTELDMTEVTQQQQQQQQHVLYRDSPGDTVVKDPPANAGDARDASSIPASRRSPGGEYDNSLQHSHLEDPMDRGA